MSNPWREAEESEPQWQQPPFAADDPSKAEHQQVVSGPVLGPDGSVAGPVAASPSGLESLVRVLARVAWPVMIALAIFGVLGWVPAILVAIVGSTVLGAIERELRQRRRVRPSDQR